MKNIKNILSMQGLSLACLVFALIFASSCKEDESGNPKESAETTLLSFGPSGVKHGDEIVFIGYHLDRVSSITFQPDVEVTDFIEQTDGQITVVVPQAAEAGHVLLKSSDGDIESKSILNFEVPVEITSISAEVKPGTNVTITGTKINWIEDVTFADELTVEKINFVSQTATELVVELPMSAQTGYLIFNTGGTEPLNFGSESELIVTLPAITSMTAAMRHTEDLTITGTDLDLVTEVILPGENEFGEPISVLSEDFSSQSETSIVLEVPVPTVDGTITLKQLSPIDVVSTDEIMIIIPVATSISNPSLPGDDLTIEGTELDQITELTFSGADAIPAANFIEHSATEIVVNIPASAQQGPISYLTEFGYTSVIGPLLFPSEGPPSLILSFYEEAINSTLFDQGGGWSGATTEWTSTAQAREGDNSIEVVYAAEEGGGAQFGQWNSQSPASTAGTEVFVFSIYGGAGTTGQNIQLAIKDQNGTSYYLQFAIDFGIWKDIEVPLADIGGATGITEVAFQNTGAWAGTVYIDRVGLSVASGPAALDFVMYDDAISDLLLVGGWGADYSDFDNDEFTRSGSKAIKVDFPGEWAGGAQMVTGDDMDPFSISGASKLAFSIYREFGTDPIGVQVALGGANAFAVEVVEGEWTDVEVPLTQWDSPSEVTEIWFQTTGGSSGTVFIDHVGFRL